MSKKLNIIFLGIEYILESYSYFFNLKYPKKNTHTSDLSNLNKDWENIGNDFRGAINKFSESSKKN